jgi:hypothetical protein
LHTGQTNLNVSCAAMPRHFGVILM